MVPGRKEPEIAKETDLKRAIAIGLDEWAVALEEALDGLADRDGWPVQRQA